MKLSKMPISVPASLAFAYAAFLVVIIVAASLAPHPINVAGAILFTAGFSFQFWTYAIWRGLTREGFFNSTNTGS